MIQPIPAQPAAIQSTSFFSPVTTTVNALFQRILAAVSYAFEVLRKSLDIPSYFSAAKNVEVVIAPVTSQPPVAPQAVVVHQPQDAAETTTCKTGFGPVDALAASSVINNAANEIVLLGSQDARALLDRLVSTKESLLESTQSYKDRAYKILNSEQANKVCAAVSAVLAVYFVGGAGAILLASRYGYVG